MKLSDYVIGFIAKEKVEHVFEMIGGAITHLADSVYKREDINCVSMHHEQAAAFAAEAYARINGRLGVAMATSGPGALNLLTPIGSCYFDSVPTLFITGQVNTYEYKFNKPARQIGFQETDIVSVVKPLVKYAVLVSEPNRIRYCLEKAVFLAQNGRPGPVLLDLPMNIQRVEINPKKLKAFLGTSEHKKLLKANLGSLRSIPKIVRMMSKAKRPVILAGGGVRTAGASAELEQLLKKTDIPVVSSLMGLDSIAHDDPRFFGMIGTYGNRYSNFLLANSDFLLILGARLDTRQTGTIPKTFARGAVKVHVDIDPHELNNKVKADIPVKSDIKRFLKVLNSGLGIFSKKELKPWHDIIKGYQKKYPVIENNDKRLKLNPNEFISVLSKHVDKNTVVCVDVGQNQMWTAQSFHIKKGQRMLISGGMGSMGFSSPAAMGAMLSAKGKKAVVICGDGGFQVNIQDIDFFSRHGLPVKIIVLNNKCLGMVREFQDMYFGGRRQSTVKGYNCPNIKKIALAYGFVYHAIKSMKQIDKTLKKIFRLNIPVLVDVKLGMETSVVPKLLINRPIEDMSPFMDRDELKEQMIIKPLEN
ncbi:MAG: thiamine pyrophosphate-binding protein [Elusimicrobia bacterium]|nr:thiamine pyrophosphate-binding protein [Elusimicrobiota bacterium]